MSKMGFDDFKKEVVDNVVRFLPESFHGEEVSLNVVTKPNDVVLTGLTIRNSSCGYVFKCITSVCCEWLLRMAFTNDFYG